MDFNTAFDGWAIALIIFLITLCIGGVGYQHFKKGKVTQKQKAGNNAKQKQEVKSSDEKNVSQNQEAGDDSNQIQIG